VAALAAMDAHEELEANRAVYARNREILLEALPKAGFGAFAPPDGAFYVYADVSHLTADAAEFCRGLLDRTGVALTPGNDFDPARGRKFVRFSFARGEDEIREGARRLQAAAGVRN
jgi:aspartate/methionine/tyrosine aminotransferase